MFTGIVDHCGIIKHIESIPSGLRLSIQHNFTQLELGESIAIEGICLTVTQYNNNTFCCELSPETLQVTNAKHFKLDQLVNLERALLPSSRLGGHFVTGHVDQLARVKSINKINDFVEMILMDLDKEAKKFIIKKGSIAINGVSLTINEETQDGFSVMLIPHTLNRTNLKHLQEKDTVNIEFDMLARMVVKQIEILKQ